MINPGIQNKDPYDILIVDDTPETLALLGRILEERGYRVRPAPKGSHALNAVAARLPGLILLDVKMPDMDGYEVCRRLKSKEKSRNVPVIFISALGEAAEKVKGFKAGGVDYITKPFEREEVLARVGSHLRLHELTDHLEQKVDQRTAELHAANARLQRELAERRRAEEALRKSEEKYRTLFENVNEGFSFHEIIADESGVPIDYRFLEINPAFEAMTGLARAKVIDKTVREVLPGIEKDPADWIGRYGKVALTGEGIHFENYSEQMGRWYQVNAFSPKVGYFAATFTDITERKLAEKELKKHRDHLEEMVIERTVELEATNKELEAFAYSVSHDLRAPLRHIDGFLGLLRNKLETVLDERERHYIDSISEAANKMGLLIDDLLAFSRMGRQTLSFQPVNLGILVRDVIAALEPDIVDRHIDWSVSDLPAVKGDATVLRSVFENLISNALKFTRPRARAEIEIGWHCEQETETVIFVRDNGVGFDMAFVDKLFGVFQRLHRADEFEGIGIGLANVRRIIARHGGRTWAEGKVDQGTTIFFTLPKHIQEV